MAQPAPEVKTKRLGAQDKKPINIMDLDVWPSVAATEL
jgi:hypothetical protein